MSNKFIRDDKCRLLLIAKNEAKRMHYKAIYEDRTLPNQICYDYFHCLSRQIVPKLRKLLGNSSETQETRVRRCIRTDRPRSVSKLFRVYRMMIVYRNKRASKAFSLIGTSKLCR
uniref:Ribosomal protein S14 n=1 Tax=Nothoceros aenigmaticus TaxID=13813 RepID=C3RYM5_9EMBR|nr:ribosomal protein S14 [Nothoceros aenigmaticus]ACC86781.1 ribosomal protein S14 [Nothoceros aenigmaticus]